MRGPYLLVMLTVRITGAQVRAAIEERERRRENVEKATAALGDDALLRETGVPVRVGLTARRQALLDGRLAAVSPQYRTS